MSHCSPSLWCQTARLLKVRLYVCCVFLASKAQPPGTCSLVAKVSYLCCCAVLIGWFLGRRTTWQRRLRLSARPLWRCVGSSGAAACTSLRSASTRYAFAYSGDVCSCAAAKWDTLTSPCAQHYQAVTLDAEHAVSEMVWKLDLCVLVSPFACCSILRAQGEAK